MCVCVIDDCVLKFCYSETGFIFCLNYKLLHQKFAAISLILVCFFPFSARMLAAMQAGGRGGGWMAGECYGKKYLCAVLFVWLEDFLPAKGTPPFISSVVELNTHILREYLLQLVNITIHGFWC